MVDAWTRKGRIWALADLRNESLFGNALNDGKGSLHGMSVADTGSWCESAVDILKDLLTSMHLTGGGPGRGLRMVSDLQPIYVPESPIQKETNAEQVIQQTA